MKTDFIAQLQHKLRKNHAHLLGNSETTNSIAVEGRNFLMEVSYDESEYSLKFDLLGEEDEPLITYTIDTDL